MYHVRKKNLADLIEFKKMFGDSLEGLFAGEGAVDFEGAAKVVYMLLLDKSGYKAKEVVTFDLDGNEKKEMVGGYKALLQEIETDEQKIALLQAFTEGMTEVKKKTT